MSEKPGSKASPNNPSSEPESLTWSRRSKTTSTLETSGSLAKARTRPGCSVTKSRSSPPGGCTRLVSPRNSRFGKTGSIRRGRSTGGVGSCVSSIGGGADCFGSRLSLGRPGVGRADVVAGAGEPVIASGGVAVGSEVVGPIARTVVSIKTGVVANGGLGVGVIGDESGVASPQLRAARETASKGHAAPDNRRVNTLAIGIHPPLMAALNA